MNSSEVIRLLFEERYKLRCSMFDWFYSEEIGIIDYKREGRSDAEDQEKLG